MKLSKSVVNLKLDTFTGPLLCFNNVGMELCSGKRHDNTPTIYLKLKFTLNLRLIRINTMLKIFILLRFV